MEITGVECIVLGTPPRERRAADQTHEVALIRITADDGSVGIGEAAVSPPVVKAFIDEPTSFAWSRGVVGHPGGAGSAGPAAPLGRALRRHRVVGARRARSDRPGRRRHGALGSRGQGARPAGLAAPRRGGAAAGDPVSHDVSGAEPARGDDPQSPTGSSTRPRPTGSARPRSRRSPIRPRTTTRSSSWRAR